MAVPGMMKRVRGPLIALLALTGFLHKRDYPYTSRIGSRFKLQRDILGEVFPFLYASNFRKTLDHGNVAQMPPLIFSSCNL